MGYYGGFKGIPGGGVRSTEIPNDFNNSSLGTFISMRYFGIAQSTNPFSIIMIFVEPRPSTHNFCPSEYTVACNCFINFSR